jgi:hypothetical protein
MKSSFFLSSLFALSALASTEPLLEEKVEYVDLETRQLGGFNGLGALVGLGIVAGALGSYLSKGGDCRCPRSTCGTGPSVRIAIATDKQLRLHRIRHASASTPKRCNAG